MMSVTHILPIESADHSQAAASLMTFVACAQLMLDPATPEPLRLQAEDRLLSRLPVLKALGLFDLFSVRDPALGAMLQDELAQLDADGGHVEPHGCSGHE